MTATASIVRPFSWRFTAPLFLGSALNPVNSALIATALPIAAISSDAVTDLRPEVRALTLRFVPPQISEAGRSADIIAAPPEEGHAGASTSEPST